MATSRIRSLVLALVAALLGLMALGTAADATGAESDFRSRADSARTAEGRAAYISRDDLVAVARRQAARMAAEQRIWHNPNLGSEVSGWAAVGENVGKGGDVASIHAAFMSSPAHRANILDGDFTEVGMGTATDASGTIYVAQVFRRPQAAAAPAPAPKPAAAPRSAATPAPAVRRAPAVAPAPRAVAASVAVRPAPSFDAAAALAARLAAAHAKSHTTNVGLERVISFNEVMASLVG
ncbi:MAG TPA: CAP domain-containing protein [Mycobacteriales bacterium]|nr:CAP domain-containing protein [Mycobacteriales bacterium]